MTVQEVKESIEYLKMQLTEDLEMICFTGDELKALDMSIQALEEVEQYRALGTVEELKHLKEMNKDCTIEQLTGVECSYNETGCSDCKGKQALLEAREKQIPKKPILIITDDNEYICSICPSCEQVSVEFDDKYCRKCGQKIGFDWEEGETSE